MKPIYVLVLLLLGLPVFGEEDASMFRGDAQHSGARPRALLNCMA